MTDSKGATVPLPHVIRSHQSSFDIRTPADPEFASALQHLDRLSPANPYVFSEEFLGKPPAARTLASWFAALGGLNRSAAGSARFYREAAHSIIDPGGLDSGHVLLLEGTEWRSAACGLRNGAVGFAFEASVLHRAGAERATLFHRSGGPNRLKFCESVICAPVFDLEGQVVAAIYASRSHRGTNQRRGIRPLEALWIQLLADSLTSALARLAKEAEVSRRQVLLEQAFPKEVTSQLLADPTALDSRQREVTVLFADLRNSSLISEALAPAKLCDLLGRVLEQLTQAIMERGGVVVDYHGDGLAAMWNAPQEQPDHASRACASAIDMGARVWRLNEYWQDRLPNELKLAIGIHTGEAMVGNMGTRHRVKYGPRGVTVNIASRLESAAKTLHIPMLISTATQDKVPSEAFATRRAATVKLKGVPEPIRLFELVASAEASPVIVNRISAFEEVGALLEQGKLNEAHDKLGAMPVTECPSALPGDLTLLAEQMKAPPGQAGTLRAGTGLTILDLGNN